MKLLIAGGSGFIGRHLTRALLRDHHDITILGRNREKIQHMFPTEVTAIEWSELSQHDPNTFDAVINLVGENIGKSRWTKTVKHTIQHSRVQATQTLLTWCQTLTQPLKFYNASAIGIYGLNHSKQTIQQVDEETPIYWGQPTDFLSTVAQAWEQAAVPSPAHPHLDIVLLRFAPVLHASDGALAKMLPLFQLGLGGKIGDGQQPFSWIHLHDAIASVQFLLNHPEITGAINICAPAWVTQQQFAKTLAHVLHRPAIIPTPAWILKLMFGQMAEELILSGQAVYPKRLLQYQFQFKYPELAQALQHRAS
ncbi:MAG: TIGR01777 family oxidoreductase [Legionellales bacterium]|nr:TIGR01777 family oxidoreductase [Legionellales bacterium]